MNLDDIDVTITKLSMRPGDTMLVSSATRLTSAQMEAVQAQVKRVLPPGVKGLIVVPGLGVEIIPAGAEMHQGKSVVEQHSL